MAFTNYWFSFCSSLELERVIVIIVIVMNLAFIDAAIHVRMVGKV